MVLAAKPLLAKLAKARMLAGKKTDPKEKFPEGKGQARDALGKLAKLSGKTVEKVEKIVKQAVWNCHTSKCWRESRAGAFAKIFAFAPSHLVIVAWSTPTRSAISRWVRQSRCRSHP